MKPLEFWYYVYCDFEVGYYARSMEKNNCKKRWPLLGTLIVDLFVPTAQITFVNKVIYVNFLEI
jgi:hypothetical protein